MSSQRKIAKSIKLNNKLSTIKSNMDGNINAHKQNINNMQIMAETIAILTKEVQILRNNMDILIKHAHDHPDKPIIAQSEDFLTEQHNWERKEFQDVK